jgi:hypothetical protein
MENNFLFLYKTALFPKNIIDLEFLEILIFYKFQWVGIHGGVKF